MNNLEKFQQAVKSNKKKLLDTGYSLGTINSWMYGHRKPSYENALGLAPLIGLDISEIPYRQVVINQ